MSPYSERRGISLPSVIIAIAIPASVWWVCLSTDSLLFAGSCAGITAIGVCWYYLSRALERVEVDAHTLRIGSTQLETKWIGTATALLGSHWEQAIRTAPPQQTWLAFRSFHPGGVRIENTDPHDPITFWFVSSRDPMALARALGQTGTDASDLKDRTLPHG